MLTRKFILKTALCLALLTGCSSTSQKIGVVDLQILYNSFDYQKELAVEYSVIKDGYATLEDSLDKMIQNRELEIKNSVFYNESDKNIIFEREYIEYLNSKDFLIYERDSIGGAYTAKIWTQINSYLKDFGEENGYDLIIGMQGDGTVMYVANGVDITEEVTVYVNSKYNGE